MVFDGTPAGLLRAAGEGENGDLERALVRFLQEQAGSRNAGAR
jgi:hypothetical protein